MQLSSIFAIVLLISLHFLCHILVPLSLGQLATVVTESFVTISRNACSDAYDNPELSCKNVGSF